ncbi:protein containing Glycoside hydrolase, family 18, catalytic domain protein, partial [human gut metagenome]
DGIDIDWEYPTSNAAGISSSPDDTKNFTLLMRDIRKAIGPKKLLTLATVASGEYIDFQAILPYIDFVNIMSYDMGNAP